MSNTVFKQSAIWANIGNVAVQTFKFAGSVSYCAHFYGKTYTLPAFSYILPCAACSSQKF